MRLRLKSLCKFFSQGRWNKCHRLYFRKVTFQGAKPEILASRFGYQAEPKHSPDGQNLALIGSDEVGNGSYFGGLAVVASLVTPADHAF